MSHTQNNTPLISRQFRRKKHDGSYTRGYGFWEDMEEPKTWDYLCQLLPNYERRDDVAFCDDLSCVIEGGHEYKDLAWLYKKYPEYDGYTKEQAEEELRKWNAGLYKEAEEYLEEAIKSGEIEIREFPVTVVSARIQGEGDNDRVWLQCADMTRSNYREELRIPSCNLQNVKSRWIDEGTDREQFQVFYEHKGSGGAYWCNAQSIDFE